MSSQFPKSVFKNKNPKSIMAAMDKHILKIYNSAFAFPERTTQDQVKRMKILDNAQSHQHERNMFEKKLKEQKKTKLKNLSLKGRGGGGSMKMPQEYSKRSLLKKPMS